MNDEQLYERLMAFFPKGKGVAVAFSGGVDSSLLLAAATDAVGSDALGVTISSPLSAAGEVAEARRLAGVLHARHRVLELDELHNPQVRSNTVDRCYHCKRMRFEALTEIAKQLALPLVVEGSCTNDLDDYRPGLKAVKELGIRSPLLDLGLSKQDIRKLSRYRGIPGWKRASNSCLATRIPYGQELELDRLRRIDRAEETLARMGFEQIRVRDFAGVAVVELLPDSLSKAVDMRQKILSGLESCGFARVCVDLAGYRTGSMNSDLGPTLTG